MTNFEQRSEEFQKELVPLQKKCGLEIYAAQVVLQNGEIVTLIKLRDLLPVSTVIDTKKYDKPKKGNPLSEETQKVGN